MLTSKTKNGQALQAWLCKNAVSFTAGIGLLMAGALPVNAAVTVATIGGGPQYPNPTPWAGNRDGTNAATQFNTPAGCAMSSDGYLYVADKANNAVRKMGVAAGTSGMTSTLLKFASPVLSPIGVAVDPAKNLYILTPEDRALRKYDLNTSKFVWTNTFSTVPSAVAVARDSVTNIYVALTNGSIYAITPAGVKTLVYSNFKSPLGLAWMPSGRIAVSDGGNNSIWLLNPATKTAQWLSGLTNQAAAFADGSNTVARFNKPTGLAATGDGSLIVADQMNHRVRLVTKNGTVSTLYGVSSTAWSGSYPGWLDSSLGTPQSRQPSGVFLNSAGDIYVTELYYSLIRKASGSGLSSTVPLPTTPTFSPNYGYYLGDQIITVSNAVGDVYYTTDGSDPAINGRLVTNKQIVWNDEFSDLSSLQMRACSGGVWSIPVYGQVAAPTTPVIIPKNGFYPNGKDIVVSNSVGSVVFYTTDGSDPDFFSSAISLTNGVGVIHWIDSQHGLNWLHLRACTGLDPSQFSDLVSGENCSIPAPITSPKSGVFPYSTNIQVGIGFSGYLEFYYSTNGIDPTMKSTFLATTNNRGTICWPANTDVSLLRVIAYNGPENPSPVSGSMDNTLPPLSAPQIGTVSFVDDGNGNLVTKLTPVTLATFYNDVILAVLSDSAAERSYGQATNASGKISVIDPAPAYSDGMFKGSFSGQSILDFTSGGWIDISIQSGATGHRPSPWVTSRVRFKVQTPWILGDNPFSFQVKDTTDKVTCYYTTDGSDPSRTNGTKLILNPNSEEISLNIPTNTTVRVIGTRPNFMDSEIASKVFSPTNFVANKISFGFAEGEASSVFRGSAGQRFFAPVTLGLMPAAKIYTLQFNLVMSNSLAEFNPLPGYGARFESMLKKPIPGITPPVFTTIKPDLITNVWGLVVTTNNGVVQTNWAITDLGLRNSIFTNLSENLLGVSWLERYTYTNLYDTLKQDLVKYSMAHDTLFQEENGSVVLGCYSFRIPAQAVSNQTYRISIGLPSASSDGIATPAYIYCPTNGSLGEGDVNSIKEVTLGHTNKYLVGSVTPFRWFNAGDFGATNLDNIADVDVLQVFQSAVYGINYPPLGSDFFDAMDSCGATTADMLDGNYTNINSIAMGDGSLDVNDVYVTYRRSIDPGLDCYVRYWAGGVLHSDKIPNPMKNKMPAAPLVQKAAQAPALASASQEPRSLKVVMPDTIINGGGTVQIPVMAQLTGNLPVRVLMESISVVPLDGAPAVTNAVQFVPATGLGNAKYTASTGLENYSGVWLESTVAGVYGTNALGTLVVTIPNSVNSGSAYAIRFNHLSASPNGFALFPTTLQDGLITVGDRSASSWNDGIPDTWRLRTFGTVSNMLSAADLDPDGDGLSNMQEYLAGTNPMDASSPLRAINPKKHTQNGFVLQWHSAANKQYTIECSPTMAGTNWTTIATGLLGDGTLQEFVDESATNTTRFYRVRLQ